MRNERSKAKQAGRKKYFTGRPCKNGHIAERQTQSGSCVECDAKHHESWFKNNPDGRRKAHLRWVAAHPGGVNERVNRWRAKNPEAARVHSHTRRARARDGAGFTKDDLLELISAQRGRCAHCRKLLGPDYHVDHIIPLVRGGENARQNIQISCPSCNRRKQARDPIDFARERGRLL